MNIVGRLHTGCTLRLISKSLAARISSTVDSK